MSEQQTKFEIWWTSPSVKRVVGAVYSLGASIVIVGALFKIQHWPFASEMLTAGMSVEAILFALGMLDKPHKDYHWENVYDFDAGSKQIDPAVSGIAGSTATSSSRNVGVNYTESISDDDVKKLSEGIKNLSTTAQQFAGLTEVVGSTNKFAKTIDEATQATEKFKSGQETLNSATGLLTSSYQGITEGMDVVEKNTKVYASKVEDINKKLASINSIYEIQLKNIQAQSEGIAVQTEHVKAVSNELNLVLTDAQKMKVSTSVAAEATETYKANTVKLAKQISDLNQVYGNMLNALN